MSPGLGKRRKRSMRADAYAVALGRGEKTTQTGHLVSCLSVKRTGAECSCGRDEWSR